MERINLKFTREQLMAGHTDMQRPPVTADIELTIPAGIDPCLVLDDRNWLDVTTYGEDAKVSRYISSPKQPEEPDPPQMKWNPPLKI